MTFKVLFGQFMHETNTFSVQPGDVPAFHKMFLYRGADAVAHLRDTNSEYAGFMDAAQRFDWTPLHTVAASANPCGKITDAAWHALGGLILAGALEPDIDGVLLALHGAMVTDSYDDAEGQLLAELREILGPDIPIAITLDLHANVSDRLAQHANIIVSYRSYPHIDMRERGLQAGELLQRTLRGEIKPHTVLARRPLLDGADGGRTDVGPMLELQARAAEFEQEDGVLAVSINAGFGLADIADVGPTVLVTHDTLGDSANTNARYQAMAEELMDRIWDTRDVITNRYLTPAEAAAIAEAHDGQNKPLIIADYADNPGAGTYGDATNLLKAMLDAGLENAAFGALRDAEAAAELVAAGTGATVSLKIGGKVDPRFGGPPLEVSGEVIHTGDGHYICDGPMWAGLEKSFGPSAVLRVGGVDILIVSNLLQITDLQQFLSNNIDPRQKKTVALKSMQHFRAAFEPIASKVIVCDCGALAPPDRRSLPFQKVRRPLYPLDPAVQADGSLPTAPATDA